MRGDKCVRGSTASVHGAFGVTWTAAVGACAKTHTGVCDQELQPGSSDTEKPADPFAHRLPRNVFPHNP